jgi:hypothetical protein
MTRLDDEFQRLFAPSSQAQGDVRALVLELTGPADWATLAAVWRGVQVDLELPAPAIAVNGRDALQLWFSLREPVSTTAGRAWLGALRARYLPDLAPRRVRLLCGVAPSSQPDAVGQAARVPAAQAMPDQWSAFIAQDLAPIFEDTPWLDIPPGDDGQAQLLAGLQRLTPAQWAQAEAALASAPAMPAWAPDPPRSVAPEAGGPLGPRSFLLGVMNDAAQPMGLRIEAAKALLPYSAM